MRNRSFRPNLINFQQNTNNPLSKSLSKPKPKIENYSIVPYNQIESEVAREFKECLSNVFDDKGSE